MKINTGFGVEWIDDLTGFKLQPINGIEPETEENLKILYASEENDPKASISNVSL